MNALVFNSDISPNKVDYLILIMSLSEYSLTIDVKVLSS